jgi:NAD(P)-dependent dehydrogenase (short-subunit alcohol dehydrogenase family)
MIDFSLQGKIALITGASRGIGKAIAITLSEHGADCILVSRKLEGLQKVVDKIEENGAKATAIACHVGYLDQIESLFKTVRNQYGRLNILVNNAGTNPYLGEMRGADEAAWDKTHDVNLKGPFFMIKHAVPLMVEAGGGAVVNVSSVSGVRPGLMQGIYSITKAGLIAMTKAYARELAAKDIRVNALLPGLTRTKFSRALVDNKEFYDQAIKRIPMGRYAQPVEMAGAVLYLLSDAASYTTGMCLTCDGGLLA